MLGRALIVGCALLSACGERSVARSAWPTTPGFDGCGFTLKSGSPRTWDACSGPTGCKRLAGAGVTVGRATSKGIMLITREQRGQDQFRLGIGPIDGAEFLTLEGAMYPKSPCAVVEADVSDEGIVIAVSRPVTAQSIEVAYFHAPLGAVTAQRFEQAAAVLPAGAFGGAMFSGATWTGGSIVSSGDGKIIGARGAAGFTEWIKGSACCTASLGRGELLFHRDESPPSAWVLPAGSAPELLYRASNRATPLVPAGDQLVWFEETAGEIHLFAAASFRRPLAPRDLGAAGVESLPVTFVAGMGFVGYRTGAAKFRVARLADGQARDEQIAGLAYVDQSGIGVVAQGALEHWPIASVFE